ncbi:hypothetical protein OIU85_024999 [Salix viminalis]|uniref:Uncharacterized protein n=1 Tax=Salix viminalis TaxID=40686 RepID=A0A9Q0Z5E0_SALVM|nr:hypothetical protein OIU85_024999 [Salix viminalis]
MYSLKVIPPLWTMLYCCCFQNICLVLHVLLISIVLEVFTRNYRLKSREGGGKNFKKPLSSGLTLEKILKSSSRYKKAKLTVSQSQHEDPESFWSCKLCDLVFSLEAGKKFWSRCSVSLESGISTLYFVLIDSNGFN